MDEMALREERDGVGSDRPVATVNARAALLLLPVAGAQFKVTSTDADARFHREHF